MPIYTVRAMTKSRHQLELMEDGERGKKKERITVGELQKTVKPWGY